MITRDFILRQIHQLGQALAQIMFLRRQQRNAEAEEAMEAALQDATGLDLARIRHTSLDDLLTLCTTESGLVADKAAMLADLLREDALLCEARGAFDDGVASRERAGWLYAAARRAGGAVPFDQIAQLDGDGDSFS